MKCALKSWRRQVINFCTLFFIHIACSVHLKGEAI
jgi:hypothetical protein